MTDRFAVLAATVMAVAVVGTTAGSGTSPCVVWNVSGSVPTGLYRVRPTGDLTINALIVAYPPEPLVTWLAEGGYLPRGVPLLKHVLARKDRRSAAPVPSSRWTVATSASRANAITVDASSRSGRAVA